MEKRGKIEILNPLGGQEEVSLKLAPRLKRLEGKTIGLLDNLKPNADVIVSRAGKRLAERIPSVKILARSKPEQAIPAPEPILREFAEKCSLVINALGD
jgi:hypothetical protein